ncbi:hypothetical protein, partial [Streptomyces sp. NPDC004546]|uniref:hypothetical protein n=1 Tax=Streptomyces sp. NPDC004546 TaxID=3154282 RepID=UPI00339EC20E
MKFELPPLVGSLEPDTGTTVRVMVGPADRPPRTRSWRPAGRTRRRGRRHHRGLRHRRAPGAPRG